MRESLRVLMLAALCALAGTSALLMAAATQSVPASSVGAAKTNGTSAPTTVATTPVVRAQRLGAAPERLEVVAAGDSTAITIVEPPFKPPATWRYEPAAVTVKVGATVTWTNAGAVEHTATADDGGTFDSGLMRPKATFSITLKSPGTFAYHCSYHRWMKGTLIVVP